MRTFHPPHVTVREFAVTILYRAHGTWSEAEKSNLRTKLHVDVADHPSHPEYIILSDQHQQQAIKTALNGAYRPFSVSYTQNCKDSALPFQPHFA